MSDSDQHRIGTYEVRDEAIIRLQQAVATVLTKELPPGHGFTLFIYPFGDDERMFYISSGDLAGNIKALERQLEAMKRRLAERG